MLKSDVKHQPTYDVTVSDTINTQLPFLPHGIQSHDLIKHVCGIKPLQLCWH